MVRADIVKPVSAKPLLYTFRRCPYAIRARLAIAVAEAPVEMHEVDLRNKPEAMLACSPKGMVPVLRLADGRVIDESLDIMHWALALHDPQQWLATDSAEARALIDHNDGTFKPYLDRYKYAARFPQRAAADYRADAEVFLLDLDTRLAQHSGLLGDGTGIADMAILPFVRQFAHVDKDWFYASRYRHLIHWLDRHLASGLFTAVMRHPAMPIGAASPP